MTILNSEDGKAITDKNPLSTKLAGVGMEGDRLKVAADLSVNEVTVSDITIRDATNPDNKQKVDSDGSAHVKVTGSNLTDAQAIPFKKIGSNAVDPNFYSGGTHVIPHGQSFFSDRKLTKGFSYLRFFINFGTAVTLDGISVFMEQRNEGGSLTGTTSSFITEVPTQKVKPREGQPLSVLISDGDIPIFEREIRLEVRNRSGNPMEIRNVVFTLIA